MNPQYKTYIIIIIVIVLGIVGYTIYKSKTSVQSDSGNILPNSTSSPSTPVATFSPTPSTPAATFSPTPSTPAATFSPTPSVTPAATFSPTPSVTPFFSTAPTKITVAPTIAPTPTPTPIPIIMIVPTAAVTKPTPNEIADPSNIISVIDAAVNGLDKYYAFTTGGSTWTITNINPDKAGSIEIGITKRPGISFSIDGIVYESIKKFDIPVGGSIKITWNLTPDEVISIRFKTFDSDILYTILTKNGNMYSEPYFTSNPVSYITSYYKIKGSYSMVPTSAPTTIAPTSAPTTIAPTTPVPRTLPLTDPNFTQIVKGFRYYWINSTISFKNISSKRIYIMIIRIYCTSQTTQALPGFSKEYDSYRLDVNKSIDPGSSVSFKMPSVSNPDIFAISAMLADGTNYSLKADYPPTNDGYISFIEVPTGQDFIFQYQP